MVLFAGAVASRMAVCCELAMSMIAPYALSQFGNGRNRVPQNQTALGQVVSVQLQDVHRQGLHFCLALDQAECVSWLATHRILRKIRVAIGDQNRLNQLLPK